MRRQNATNLKLNDTTIDKIFDISSLKLKIKNNRVAKLNEHSKKKFLES